jgi:hypothetical protein
LLAISFCWMKAYVLDTDVLVAAFRSDAGASSQLLEALRELTGSNCFCLCP